MCVSRASELVRLSIACDSSADVAAASLPFVVVDVSALADDDDRPFLVDTAASLSSSIDRPSMISQSSACRFERKTRFSV